MKYRINEDDLKNAINNSFSIAEVCRKLNIRPVGGNYKLIHCKIKVFNLDTSHFTGRGWLKGKKYISSRRAKLTDILVKDSTYTNSYNLKNKLYNEGIKEHKCEVCGISEWNDKKLSLQLDHVNGDSLDNRLENLRIICPNCHSQTDNFAGKSKKKSERNIKKSLPLIWRKIKLVKTFKKCLVCGEDCRKGKKYCSYECLYKNNSKNIPPVDEIFKAFEKFKNFVQVGKYFKVSDNAVRKWCKRYGVLEEIKSIF